MAADILERREKEMALRANAQNRGDLIKFYKALAMQDGKSVPPEMRKKEAQSTALSEAAALLKEKSGKAPAGRLALAEFLLDRTRKVREFALKKDSLSLYSLYVSLRNRVTQMLGPGYYEKSGNEVLDDYLDIEPLVAACSELCGLSMPTMDDISGSSRP